MATTDLPTNFNTGSPFYELEDPLERLSTMMNKRNIDIESLDQRGIHQNVMFRGFEPRELQTITNFVDMNPKQNIMSSHVRDLNDLFNKDLDTSNPNYIFRDDVTTRNNIGTIQKGIQSFVKDRDLFVVPPSANTQQKILDLLKK